jgi:hypothetical protein
MSRLIATQVTVKNLQEVSKLHEKGPSQDGEDGTVTQITVDPKASLNFRGMAFVFPTRNLGCMFSHSEREKVKSVRLNLSGLFHFNITRVNLRVRQTSDPPVLYHNLMVLNTIVCSCGTMTVASNLFGSGKG